MYVLVREDGKLITAKSLDDLSKLLDRPISIVKSYYELQTVFRFRDKRHAIIKGPIKLV